MRLIRATILVVVLASLCVGLAAAHGNDVEVDDQVSSDGTLVVGHVTNLEDAYLVAREATGDGPGDPVGHRHLDAGVGTGDRDLVTLSLDDAYWEALDGTASLWVVLHNDGGGDGFSLDDDPLLERGDEPVGTRISVGRGDGNVSAVAFDQESDATVTVRRVELAEPGYVVLHAESDDGPMVGRTALDAGVHHNVTVPVDGYHYNEQNDSFALSAVVYRDDGDGEFGADDASVMAGDASVSSEFEVTKSVSAVDVTPTATDTTTVTETPTTTATDTAATTETATPVATDTTAGDAETDATPTQEQAADADGGETDATAGGGSGFGLLAGALAVLVASLLARRRF